MASFIPSDDRPVVNGIPVPLTLAALQRYVGGFIRFIELASGDVMVVNEAGPEFAPLNKAATDIAHQPIHWHAVLCTPTEIA
jgi:hypothetical protein